MDEFDIIKTLEKYLAENDREKHNLKLKILPYCEDNSKDKTVRISGSRDSLVSLAAEILEVAFGDFNHCHSDMGSAEFVDYDAELCVELEYGVSLLDKLSK